MPTFEFQCKKCEAVYEAVNIPYDETGKWKGVACPECGSKKKEKLVSMPTFAFSNPEGTDRWNSDSKGHDYRFKHNIPKVKAEREAAQALSHMGTDPYGDTTEQDLKLDTGVHDSEDPIRLLDL